MKFNKKTIIILLAIISIIVAIAVILVSSNDTNGEDMSPKDNNTNNEQSVVQGDTNTNQNQNTNNKDNSQEVKIFPYNIPDTGLVINKIESYSGEYFEDGSNSNVSSVATMLLTNNSSSNIEYGEIYVKSGKETLTFVVSGLPKGKNIIVQEKNKKTYDGSTDIVCTATVATLDEFEKNEKLIKIEETDKGAIKVTNVSDKDIPTVRIFYKYYMDDEEIYVGGITYTAKISNLKKNDTQEVFPKHYVNGYSEILMVRLYEE